MIDDTHETTLTITILILYGSNSEIKTLEIISTSCGTNDFTIACDFDIRGKKLEPVFAAFIISNRDRFFACCLFDLDLYAWSELAQKVANRFDAESNEI